MQFFRCNSLLLHWNTIGVVASCRRVGAFYNLLIKPQSTTISGL